MRRGKKWVLPSLVFAIIILLLSGWSDQVQSQEKYPTRAIDIIVPFSPGGSTDLATRVVADYLKKKWGVPVNVINKPGGNTVPACLDLYSAVPDGYTLLADNNSSSSMLEIAVKNLPLKIMDRTFIAVTTITPMMLIVPSTSPIKSLKDLEAEAKKNPENLTWASVGGTAGQDVVTRQFLKAIGVDVLKTRPVMVVGGAQAVVLTAGGHVVLGSGSPSTAIPAIRGGTVRALAITSRTRYPDLPNVPTFKELGYPTVNYLWWIGISGPPKLPSYIFDIWDKTSQEMLKDPEIISKLGKVGTIPFYLNARETIEYVMKEAEEMAKLWSLK